MINKIHSGLRRIVQNSRWSAFTDIQKEAFDPIYNGENCIVEAPTSGGKTEAVLFPVLTKAAENKAGGVRVLYIAPLKALLNDIELRADKYAQACGLRAFKWHGDVSQKDKVNQMLFPAELMLTTPESLEAILLRKGNWNEVFNQLQSVIIDEAHSFALAERGLHLISLLERLENELKVVPQRIGITATIGNPDKLLEWLLGRKRRAGKRIYVKAAAEKEKDFILHYISSDNHNTESAPVLNQKLYDLLLKKKSIVFRNSRTKTEESAKYINDRNRALNTQFPLNVRTHHSSVSKYYREAAERLIKMRNEKELHALITTSTLELGIDIGDLNQVVQIGGLSSSGSFLQRVGRTGRRPGKPQFFRGLCEDEEELLLLAACINLGVKGISESIIFPKKAYHILAHQIICLCLQKTGIGKDALYKILSNSYCFSAISMEKFELLLDYMVQSEYLRMVEDSLLVVGIKTEERFLKANWKRLFAVFDSGPMYDVVDGKKIIGTLDIEFVLAQQEPPWFVVLGGVEWKVKKVKHETRQVVVVKTEAGNVPKWNVFSNSEVPFETAKEVGRLLIGPEMPPFLDGPAKSALQKLKAKHNAIGWNENCWVFDQEEGGSLRIWTFSGDKINRVIAALVKLLNLGKCQHDYQKVVVDADNRDYSDVPERIAAYLKSYTNKSREEIENAIISTVPNHLFSKYTSCLPELLSKERLIDKSMDIDGFLCELKSIICKI